MSFRKYLRMFFLEKYSVPKQLYQLNELTFYSLVMNKSHKFELLLEEIEKEKILPQD